jgi:Skp family chaperone for outer membrane proteins
MAFVAALVVVGLAALAFAQQGVQPLQPQQPTQPMMRPSISSASQVALLDLNYVFKNYSKFKAAMDEMKESVKQADADIKGEQERIRQLAEQAKQYHPGTPDYKNIEAEVAKRDADLKVRLQLQRREFLEREAKIYHSTYLEIQQEVAAYCQQYGIVMVLRCNTQPINSTEPEDILRGINEQVVYSSQDRNITGAIFNQLEQRYRGAAQRVGVRPTVTPQPNYQR